MSMAQVRGNGRRFTSRVSASPGEPSRRCAPSDRTARCPVKGLSTAAIAANFLLASPSEYTHRSVSRGT